MSEFTSIRFTLNRRSRVKYEKLEGVEHVVVPTTMMVEGVHCGSKGPLYYSANQLSKNPSAWDHKPAVHYHPKTNDGNYISACTPEVLNTSKVGILLNTRYKAKQQTDVYLNIKRTDEIDYRIMEAIRNESPMNVSTGMWYDVVGPKGVWNGEEYLAEVGSFVPDHLAILPDQDGACSIADGAGMLVNEDLPKIIIAANNSDIKRHLEAIQKIVLNEMSADQVFSALLRAVRASVERFGQSWDGWIQDVYPKFFVYTSKGVYYKQVYKTAQNSVELVGTPTVVVRTYGYETADGFEVNTDFTSKKDEKEMANDVNSLVQNLITNGGWPEEQRTFLLSLKPDQLQMIVNNNKATTGTAELKSAGGTIDMRALQTPNSVPTPSMQMLLSSPTVSLPAPAPIPVVNQTLGNSPAAGTPSSIPMELNAITNPELRSLLANLLQEREARKLGLVNVISAVPGNRYNPEWLKTQSVEFLEGLVSIARGGNSQVLNYAGNQFGATPVLPSMYIPANGSVVTNQNQVEQPVLDLP